MRVLIVHPYLIYGGAETAIINLSKYMISHGIENRIIALAAANEFIKDPSLDIKVKTTLRGENHIRKSESTVKALSLILDALILRKLVSRYKGKYDIINPHNIPSTWAAILQKKPVVWMMNEPPDIYINVTPSPLLKSLRNLGIMMDTLLVKKYVNQICVNSYLTYEQARKRYGKVAEIVLFGIDYDKYSKGNPTRIIEKYNLQEDFVVITVGWISPQKNQLESIKAVEKARKHIPKIKLILAGRGDNSYERLLKNYVKSKKLNEHVIFTGFISEEEKRDLYHACHLGLYPFKGQGGLLVPFENICATKPVIVSPTYGAADIIASNKLLVTQNYAEAILKIFNNYKHFRALAFEAREFVKKELTWEKYGERLLKVFERWDSN
jgi:glycosyltransferase involved in cell wall biosynthesis